MNTKQSRLAVEQNSAYTVDAELGSGASGCCWLVRRSDREGKYVAKTIGPVKRLTDHQKKALSREVELLSSISHPFVIRYREMFTASGYLVMIMDHANTGSLSRLVGNGKPVSEESLCTVASQVAFALLHLHAKKIVHRDIKANNIFLHRTQTGDLRCKVGDFGLARSLHGIDDGNPESDLTCCGTPQNMAPELFSCGAYSTKVDTWALGCVLYQLATTRLPFAKPPGQQDSFTTLSARILNTEPEPVQGASASVQELISGLLTKDPEKRWDAHDVLSSQACKEYSASIVAHTSELMAFTNNAYFPASPPIPEHVSGAVEGAAKVSTDDFNGNTYSSSSELASVARSTDSIVDPLAPTPPPSINGGSSNALMRELLGMGAAAAITPATIVNKLQAEIAPWDPFSSGALRSNSS
eukprot:CAMPEP_0185173050 /NCGR_PEP_ID=MMETSP1139-20130426/22702_1 /TAXON_ID=298111 /ORGANISM="Pavlova sp., Strain CCMP459" /LENGTH=412 /DNA_ID=CAMNT_0027738725 /DNA_START=52 /DNA_END=1290 /DNA_ORIENTATION=-